MVFMLLFYAPNRAPNLVWFASRDLHCHTLNLFHHVVKSVHDLGINKSPCISHFKTKNNLFFSFLFLSSSYQTFNNRIKFHNTKNIDSGPSYETKKMYNMNGFRTETMYDYYIAMKSMFLVVKLFSHPSIVYGNFTILLP